MNARLAIYGLAALALTIAWGGAFVIWRAAELGDLIAPLETREFERLEVIAIGTGNAYENPTRLGPAIAVASGPTLWLVDAGRGVAEGLRNAMIPVSQPEAVFLTSLLPENTVGIDDLLMTGFIQGRSAPLQLIGPPGTAELAAALERAHARGAAALVESLALDPAGARIEATEIDADWGQTRGDVNITAAAIGGGPLLAFAWKFENAGPTVVISGAGWGEDTLVQFARGADLLVHESAYIPNAKDAEAADVELDLEQLALEEKLHTGLNDVGAVARDADVRRFALVRLRPPPFYDVQITLIVGRSYDGDIRVPEDGETLYP
jgi:ribonuclease Z